MSCRDLFISGKFVSPTSYISELVFSLLVPTLTFMSSWINNDFQ